MALTWLLAIATYTNVTKRRGDKEEWAYLTIASAAHVFKTLTNSLECQVGTLSSAELDRSSEMKISGGSHETHPCKTSEGVSTKFDRNKSLSSAVKELSRIARRNGSMK